MKTLALKQGRLLFIFEAAIIFEVEEVAVYISFHRHIFRNARDLVKYAHIFHFTVESTAPYCNV